MKAEELLKEALYESPYYGDEDWDVFIRSGMFTATIEAMKEYAKLKCKEQRDNCGYACDSLDIDMTGLGDDARNAQEPDFD